MLVEDMMVKDVHTLKETDPIERALRLMKEKKIRHIPVVDGEKRVIGIVTDRDIRSAVPSVFYSREHEEVFQMTVKSIMKRDVITVHPLDFVEDAAVVLFENRIGCLPVVKENRLVGIITQTDVLEAFIQLVGANQPGSRIEVRVPNRAGMLHEVAGLIREHHVNIHSVLAYPDKKGSDDKILVFRLGTMNPRPIADKIREKGFAVLWPVPPEMKS